MADQVLICRTCGKEFSFSQREQEFFAAKQFAEPRHCQECRAARKREKSDSVDGMEVGAARPIRQEHGRIWTEVACATCGKPAQVPFKPTGDKPVYCKECFAQAKNSHEIPSQDVSPQALPIRPSPLQEKPPTPSRAVSGEIRKPVSSTPVVETHQEEWLDDPGPLPDFDPAPDEEGEITVADYIPMPISFGSTPEEVNPSFNESDRKKTEK